MKTNVVKTLGATLAALALTCLLSSSAQAALTSIGGPFPANSWAQGFYESGVGNFDRMAISYVAGSQFEVPAFRDFSVGGWSQTSGTAIAANSTGGALNYLVFNIFFEDPQLQPTVFNFYAWNGTTLLEATRATFDGGAWSFQPIPVPEPTTMIAGALLLLPFGISTIRRLRRS